MIKWFEGNPIGLALSAVCGGLLLVALLLGVVWSLPPSASGTQTSGDSSELALDIPVLEDSEPLELYAVITERPLFNETRLPVLEEGLDGDEEDVEEEEVDAPDVELAGVIITPSIRMATLRVREQTRSLVAFEGQPLEGNFGSWQISRILPREVTLSSAKGEEVQIQLLVHDKTMKEPVRAVPAESADSAAEADGKPADEGEPLSRAEEIRQRIAQRREELRRAADDKEQEEKQKPNYQQAIQSMISGSRQKEEKDENQ